MKVTIELGEKELATLKKDLTSGRSSLECSVVSIVFDEFKDSVVNIDLDSLPPESATILANFVGSAALTQLTRVKTKEHANDQ